VGGSSRRCALQNETHSAKKTAVGRSQTRTGVALPAVTTWPAFFRLAITLLALCTFSVQSFVVQTHIHGLATLSAAAPVAGPVVKAPHDPKAPPDGDPASCQICQEFLHGGIYVLPSAIAALPPTLAVEQVVLLLVPQAASNQTSHSWMGRAPPQA
jgi:hypothetical protein